MLVLENVQFIIIVERITYRRKNEDKKFAFVGAVRSRFPASTEDEIQAAFKARNEVGRKMT